VPKRAATSFSIEFMRLSCCFPSELACRESRRLNAACSAASLTRLLSSSASFASGDSNAG
jgi:hypothetical protein